MPLDNSEMVLKIGPFSVRIQSPISSVQAGLVSIYQEYPRLPQTTFCDFFVRVFQPVGLRRFVAKQVLFAFDQFIPFKPLPYAQAFPFFEWGLNWCISGYSHQYLIIHAAVVEKHGKALVLPGTPGAGKSTLCAALINNGWRLLSDELTLIDCATGYIVPVPRPVSLKNDSIQLIGSAFPDSAFSPIVHDTLKGSVSLMKPPGNSVYRAEERVLPCLVVFPKFQGQAKLNLSQLSRAEAFMRLADLSFNYGVLGPEGFNVLGDFIGRCTAFDFVYDGDFVQASDCFEQLLLDSL